MDSEVLARIQPGFHTMVETREKPEVRIDIICFYEELPLPVFGTVHMTTINFLEMQWNYQVYFILLAF
jgi:hypothetical protein